VYEQVAEFSTKYQRIRFHVLTAVCNQTADFWDGVL